MNQSVDQKLLSQAVDAFEFRPARAGDIEVLVDLFHDYFDESYLPTQGLVFDPKRAWATLFQHISKGDNPFLIAIENERRMLAGAISYNINHDFTEKPFANLDKFYVRKPWRRSAVPRVLLTLCLEIARADGAEAFNASLNSGMAETASAKNLFAKLGFEPLDGVLLTRRF